MQIYWHAITVSRKPIFVESSTVGDHNENIDYVVIEKLYIGIYACDNYRKIWSTDFIFYTGWKFRLFQASTSHTSV